MDETKTLAAFVEEISLDNIPPDVQEKAKEAIIDYIGVALFGSQHDVGNILIEYTDAVAGGTDATILATGRSSPSTAALANGAFGHAVDYDDTFESIVLHPTSPVFAAALAAGETVDASGADILPGYIVGVDVAYRTGHSTYPEHYDNGCHSTGTTGTFGATAAAAHVLDLETDEIRRAFGIAASMSSSLKKNFGTMTKPLHSGHAAQMGVRSAMLAKSGFTSDPNVFEGEIGYGNVMTPNGQFDPSEITDDLGEKWAVMDIGYKPYPSGVITHAAMDAMRQIVQEHDLTPTDVNEVVVSLDEAASEMLHHESPQDELEAKFSIEFCLAAVLRKGDAGIHEFTDEYVTADRTREVMDLVERDFENNLFGQNFANYGARVSVYCSNGKTITREEKYAPGSPNNPISDDRLEAKFKECANVVLEAEQSEALLSTIRSFESPGAFDEFRELVESNRLTA